jgi:cytochrome c6
MLSTSLVVAALSTGHKIGLASVGGAFILFALVSSLVLPRRDLNFPGRGVGWYVLLGILFFAAMMAAVIVFGREKPEAKAAGTSTPAQTSTSTPSPAPATGNAAAGKIVFTKTASPSCAGCHTLKDAGSTGTVGPNLDQLKPGFARVKRQVENGGAIMPPFKDKLSAKQIDDVAAYVSSVAGS